MSPALFALTMMLVTPAEVDAAKFRGKIDRMKSATATYARRRVLEEARELTDSPSGVRRHVKPCT